MLKSDGDIIVTQKGVADTFFSDVDRDLSKKIKKLKDVKSVQSIIVGAGAISDIPIAGIYGVSKNRMLQYKLVKGIYPKRLNDVIIGGKINTLLNNPKNLQIFGENFRVTGVYKSDIGFEEGGVVIRIQKASEMFKKSSSFLLISLKNIANPKPVISQIKQLSDKIDVKSTNDFIKNYNQFKIIKISGAVIASVSFLMGFLSITSIMSIMINDRKYEFGIKRAMGIPKRIIFLEVIIEVTVLVIASFLVALMLSEIVLEVLKSIDKFQGYLNGDIDVSLMFEVLFGSLLMSVIGASIPAFMASKTDPIVLIHQGS